MIKTSMLAAMLLLAALPAQATTLVLDSGWQDDQVDAAATPSNNSPWTFTLTSSAYFRVTDAFNTGDVYTITDASSAVLGTTTFTTDGAAVPAYFNAAWTDTSFSRISLLLTAGSYSLSVAGDCAGGCPAGFGVRLDTATVVGAVPEPANWALLIAGFGLTGAAMRRRRVSASVTA